MLLLNRTLLRLSKGLWGWILSIVACKLLILAGTARLSLLISSYLGNMLDPDMTLSDAGSAILTALLISVLLLALDLVKGELEYRTTAKARRKLRRTIFSRIMELDVGHIEQLGPTKAITSAVDGVESMQSYYSQYLPGMLYSLLAPVYLFFQFKKASLPIAVFLLVIALLILPINNVFRDRIEKLRGKYWGSLEDLTQYYLESIRGLATFKLFERDKERSDTLKEKAFSFTDRILAFMKVNFTSFLVTEALMYGAILIAVLVTGVSLVRGNMTISNALLILMLSYSFFASIKELMGATHSALAGVAAAGRLEDILGMDTSRPYHPDLPVREDAPEGIWLDHVSHTYPDDDMPDAAGATHADTAAVPEPGDAAGAAHIDKAAVPESGDAAGAAPADRTAVPHSGDAAGTAHAGGTASPRRPAVNQVTLSCLKGQVSALVGPSGCGKSTLAGLMMRFFDPSEGHIYLNGRDYESFTPEELRTQLVMVPQSVTIFSGTIKDNLLLAREDASDAQLWDVLEEVRLADWVHTHAEGLDYSVGDAGAKLSGGQKQKLGIARALLCEAEYIILDEATSNIDRESEEEIWACIRSLALKRTLIIISHRLSTIRNANQIYVLNNGCLIEAGTHEALLAHKALYAELVTQQEGLEAAITREEGQTA